MRYAYMMTHSGQQYSILDMCADDKVKDKAHEAKEIAKTHSQAHACTIVSALNGKKAK